MLNKENLISTFKESILILIYEFLGTSLIALLFTSYSKSNFYIIIFHSFSIKLWYFIIIK